MTNRSFETRLQKLEGIDRPGGMFVVISCGGSGNTEGAKAYFEELTGNEIGHRDTLVLMHTVYTRDLNGPDATEPPSYKILTYLDNRGVAQVIRKRPAKAAS